MFIYFYLTLDLFDAIELLMSFLLGNPKKNDNYNMIYLQVLKYM